MKKYLTKKNIFIFGSIIYILAYLIYLYKAENTVFWNCFYYIKDYSYLLFILILLKSCFTGVNKLIAFIIVLVFQYLDFNIVMITKTLTDFEKYCNSQVFTLMFINTTLSLGLFALLTRNKKDKDS
jgi:hypothetical protein